MPEPTREALRPPAAARRPTVLRAHGDERVDDWFWLRDRDDPAVIAYLEEENRYTEAMTAHLAGLRERLFEEFRSRVQETDDDPPVPHGGHWYFTRTVEGLEYEIHCRRSGSPDAPEQVLLDENALAAGAEFFELRAFEVSPDHRLVAYGVNYDGSDDTDLRFRDLTTGRDLDDVIEGVTDEVAWASDNRTVLYVARDRALRPFQAWTYRLGDPASHRLVYEELDERFRVSVERTKSGAFLLVTSASARTSEVRFVPADSPGSEPALVEPRREGVRYFVDHNGDRFFIVTDDGGAVNHKLMEAPVATPGRDHWREVVAHRDDVRLHDVDMLRDWLVLEERAGAVRRLRALRLADGLERGFDVPEEVSTSEPGPNPEFDRSVYRFVYESMITPETTFDVDLDTGARTLVKRQPVLGGYDPADYRTHREWARSADGTLVPISIVRRADTPLDGTAPALLYGYGSYEHSMDPAFSPFLLSLLDRGMVFAVAHVRGGGELGRRWYEDGKFLAKRNSFADFVACAERLVEARVSAPDRLAAMGGSAGGLLVGAVLNQRPELFRAVVALVPFVDVVTTMLDESIPLTVPEYEEWGNPAEPEFYEYMKSYSPYDGVRPQHYPALLVTTGINDTRVAFWEPAKWVAKLRATATGGGPILLKTELGAGHAGPSGRYGEWRERAFWYAFLLDALGLA